MTDSPVTVRELQALSHSINAIKGDMARMFKDHEKQERQMLEPIMVILNRHDVAIFSTEDDNTGLILKVDRLETHKKSNGTWTGILTFFTATNFLELLKRFIGV